MLQFFFPSHGRVKGKALELDLKRVSVLRGIRFHWLLSSALYSYEAQKHQNLSASLSKIPPALFFAIATSPLEASDLCFGPIIKNPQVFRSDVSLAKEEIRAEK